MKRVFVLAIMLLQGCQLSTPPYLVNDYEAPCLLKVEFEDASGVFECILQPRQWIGGKGGGTVCKIEVYDLERHLLQSMDGEFIRRGFAADADHSSLFAVSLSTAGATYLSKREFKSKDYHSRGVVRGTSVQQEAEVQSETDF